MTKMYTISYIKFKKIICLKKYKAFLLIFMHIKHNLGKLTKDYENTIDKMYTMC